MPPPRLNPGPSGFRTLAAAEICDLHDMWRMGVLRGVRVTSDWTSYVENHRGPAGLPPVRGYVDQQGIHVYWPSGRIPGPGVEGSTTPATEADVPRWVRENFVRVEPGSRVDPVSLGESGSSALRPLDHRAAELVHRYPEVFPGHRIAPDSGQYAEAWRDHTTRLEEMERVAPGTLGNEPVPPHGFMDHEGRYHLPPHTAPDPAAVDVLARTDIAVNPLGPTQPGGVDPLGPTQPGAQGSAAAAPYLSPIAEPGPTGYRALTMEEALDVRAAFGQAGVRHGVASATAGFDEYRANHAISHPGQPLPMNGYVDRNGVHFHLLPDARVANPDAMPPPLRDAPAYQAWLQAHTTEMPAHQLVELGRRHPDAIVAGVSVASDAAGYQRHYLEDMLSGRISRGEADHLRALKGHNPDAYDARLSQLATEHHVAPEPPPQGYWSERALHLPPASDAPPSAAADHPPQSGSTLTGVAPPLVGNHPPQSGTTLTGVAPPAPPDHPGTSGGGRDGFRPLTLDEARTAGTALDRGSPVTVHAVEVTSAVGDFATYRAAFEHAHPGHAVPMMGYRDANGVHIFWTPGRVPDSDAPAPPLRDGSPASEAAYSEWLNRHTSEIPENHLAHAVARDPHLLPGAERLSDAGEYAFAYRRAEVLSFLHDDNPTMLRRLEKLERSHPERFHAEINARADRLNIGDPPASGFFGQNGRFTFLDPAATVAPGADALPTQLGQATEGSALAHSVQAGEEIAAGERTTLVGLGPTASDRTTLLGLGPAAEHTSEALLARGAGGALSGAAGFVGHEVGSAVLWAAGEWAVEKLSQWANEETHRRTDPKIREAAHHADEELAARHAEIAQVQQLPNQPVWGTYVIDVVPVTTPAEAYGGRSAVGRPPVPTDEYRVETSSPRFVVDRPETGWTQLGNGGAHVVVAVPQNQAAIDIEYAQREIEESIPRHERGTAERIVDAVPVLGESRALSNLLWPDRVDVDARADAQVRASIRDIVVREIPGRTAEVTRLAQTSSDGAVWATVTIVLKTHWVETTAGPPRAVGGVPVAGGVIPEVGEIGLTTRRPTAGVEEMSADETRIHIRIPANDAARLVEQHEREEHADGAWIPAPDGPAEPPTLDSSGTAGAAKEQFVPDKDHDHAGGKAAEGITHSAHYVDATTGNPYAPLQHADRSTGQMPLQETRDQVNAQHGHPFTDKHLVNHDEYGRSFTDSQPATSPEEAVSHSESSGPASTAQKHADPHGDASRVGHEFGDKSENHGAEGHEFSDKSQDNGDPGEPDANDSKLTTGDNHKDEQYQALESGAPG